MSELMLFCLPYFSQNQSRKDALDAFQWWCQGTQAFFNPGERL